MTNRAPGPIWRSPTWQGMRQRVQLALALALVLLAAIGVVSYRSVADLQSDITRVAHTHEVIGALHGLLATVTDAETAQRGYTITGQEPFLGPYHDAVDSVDGQLRQLRLLVGDNPAQARQLDLLSPIVAQRIATLGRTIAARRTGGFDSAAAQTAVGGGRALQDRIRALVGIMERTERGLLETRTARAAAAARRTRAVIVSGGILAALVVGGGLLLIGRDFMSRAVEMEQAHQATRETSERYQRTLDNMLEGCQIIGTDWRYKYVNDTTVRHGRQPREALLGRTMMEVYPGIEETPVFKAIARCMSEGVAAQMENEFNYPDGTSAWFELSIQPAPEGIFILSMDITERVQAEQRQREINAELEARVAERTRQLEAANHELEAFSYSVSHDLRSPLRTMDGFSQAVIEDFGALLPADGVRQLHTIRQGAQRMGALIDDLLTFAKLSRQPLRKQRVDMTQLARDTMDELRRQEEGRRIEATVAELPAAQGDPVLLKLVWQNLLSNALKYSRQRDTAVITVRAAVEGGRTAYVVQDNGVGFDMRYADKLFGVFQRLHRAEDFEGTGVGLAIVQRIVHRHGGRVWAEASVNAGATFSLTLDGGDIG